jgi:hypothetical protein
MVVANACGERTPPVLAVSNLTQASCSTSSASLALPSMRYAIENSRGGCDWKNSGSAMLRHAARRVICASPSRHVENAGRQPSSARAFAFDSPHASGRVGAEPVQGREGARDDAHGARADGRIQQIAGALDPQPVRGREVAGAPHPLLRLRRRLVDDVRRPCRLHDLPKGRCIERVRDGRRRPERSQRLLLVGRPRQRRYLMPGLDERTDERNADLPDPPATNTLMIPSPRRLRGAKQPRRGRGLRGPLP